MLKALPQIILSICMLTGCQINGDKFTLASEAALIDYRQLSLPEQQLYTHYHAPHSCEHSLSQPDNEQPYWLEPSTVWQRIPLGYQLQQVDRPRLQAEFNWYKRHPSYMSRVSERAERYAHYIIEQVEQRNMPSEIALLPIVESAFDPFAYSHGRASGMWQFIPGTAKMFNLKSNWWYDGRRDTLDSTQAALDYLQYLADHYDGDWLLALAAYNSGQGTVNKAIRKNRKKGKATDFWALDLPQETRSYVPKLLALAKLIEQPKRYGLNLYPVANQPYFDVVDIGSQIDLAQAAEMAEVDIEEIYKLNPAFNRWATDPEGPHRLLVPHNNASQFSEKVSLLSKTQRLHWQRYTVKNGDSLLLLAKRFNTGVETIRQTNNIKGNMIRSGQKLMIPMASQQSQHYAYSAKQRSEKIKSRRSGGTGTVQVFHQVQEGESLWTIARKHGVSSKQIAHWNGFAPKDLIRPGQKLSLWVKAKPAAEKVASLALAKAQQRDAVMKKLGYTVRSGDSLAGIADKFKVNLQDIISWNSVNPKKYLQPGQRLTLYIDVMNRY
ncbi:LysM peptidoglycan-binding domain-containing protein [Dasania marina]|uniref:lytic transglycosylase n=1 Tax=Dasania marina TaxID=471499 RepID=UPI0030D882D7|tara:strand:- start:9380 stop:11032 length:1653 start_codon:yes stop_codon:yes gene_type:complete